MTWVIGVNYKNTEVDPIGRNVKAEIEDLGLPVQEVKSMQVYFLQGELDENQVKKACQEILADNIIQEYHYSPEEDSLHLLEPENTWIIQVTYHPGVTDAVGENALKALEVLGLEGVEKVESGTTYLIKSQVNEEQIKKITEKILANPLIQDYEYVKT